MGASLVDVSYFNDQKLRLSEREVGVEIWRQVFWVRLTQSRSTINLLHELYYAFQPTSRTSRLTQTQVLNESICLLFFSVSALGWVHEKGRAFRNLRLILPLTISPVPISRGLNPCGRTTCKCSRWNHTTNQWGTCSCRRVQGYPRKERRLHALVNISIVKNMII